MMDARVTLNYEMQLVSDAIFSAGYSIPGGKDITVYRDEDGYPYFRGSGLKGLLRESTENLLCWLTDEQDAPAAAAAEERLRGIFGTDGWNGISDSHRLQLTPLTLKDRPEFPEQCYAERTFTKLENGTAAEKTLRSADCIRRGLVFCGSLSCHSEDADLLKQALCCIRWAGSLRSRGFGQVSFTITGLCGQAENHGMRLDSAVCIHYRLHTELPVLITNLQGSTDNSYASKDYIPGSTIRGMVISTLAQNADRAWFEENRKALLSDSVRFLNALPDPGNRTVIPVIKGFYEDKQEKNFKTVLLADIAGLKRAKMGSFCTVDRDTIRFWSGETGSVLRIGRNQKEDGNSTPFQTGYLCAGQDFDGYILLDRPELASAITQVLSGEIWIGADRYEGFGKCTVTLLEAAEQPAWQHTYGYAETDSVKDTLYLLAVSPFTMLGQDGSSCGLDEDTLAAQLGIAPGSLQVEVCSTSMSEYGAYNRTWGCREPAERMYDSGSIFRLHCSQAPATEAVLRVQREGLGIRRSEGYGQILFMKPECFEGIRQKEKLSAGAAEQAAGTGSAQAEVRRARCSWVMENAGAVRKLGLSKSQLGNIQAICEEAIGADRPGNLAAYLAKKLQNHDVNQKNHFEKFRDFVEPILERPLSETLRCDAAGTGTTRSRLELLTELFNFTRKEDAEA